MKRPDSSFRNALVANDLRVVPPPPRIRNETMTKPKADKDHKHARIQCTKTRQMKIARIAQCPPVSPRLNAMARIQEGQQIRQNHHSPEREIKNEHHRDPGIQHVRNPCAMTENGSRTHRWPRRDKCSASMRAARGEGARTTAATRSLPDRRGVVAPSVFSVE